MQTNTTKIKQFADDTTLTINDEKDMKLAISIVEQFQEFFGLRLNRRKWEGIWMGSRKHERGRIHDIPMKGMIQILGICYSAEKEASILEDNWTSKAIPCSTETGVKQGLFIYKICGSMVTS